MKKYLNKKDKASDKKLKKKNDWKKAMRHV